MAGEASQWYYFLLSGSHTGLAEGELDALLEIQDAIPRRQTSLTQLRIIQGSRLNPCVIRETIGRAGYLKEGGRVLALLRATVAYSRILEAAATAIHSMLEEKGHTCCVVRARSIHGFSKDLVERLRRDIIALIRNPAATDCQKQSTVSIIATDGVILVGEALAVLDTKSFHKRRPSTRPFFRSIAMSPQLSRALVNLSRTKRGSIFLDPFCGTGSILIEASLIGAQAIGIDASWDMVVGSRTNLKHYGLLGVAEVIVSDAMSISVRRVDAIATDPPYGRSASTHGEDPKKLYRSFIEGAGAALKSRSYMVFIAPQWLEEYVDKLLCREGFILRRKYYMYVHSALTRVVYEVVRI